MKVEDLEARMRPGQFSRQGFLAPGERLADVMERDARTLAELELTCEELAAPLDALLRRAEAAHTRRFRDDRWDVRIEVYKGFQICPWAPDPHYGQCTAGGGVEHGSVDWRILNRRSDLELSGSGLIVHLIRDHHFFEGFRSVHRVEPRELARLLELGPFRR